jgi:hypothetical protein
MPSWPPEARKAARQWETDAGCLLHWSSKGWECWSHDSTCPSIAAGQLRPPAGHDGFCCGGAHPAPSART